MAMSLLERQAAAFRRERGIPEALRPGKRLTPPSVLFTQEEVKWQDTEAVAALALRGIAAVAAELEPDVTSFAVLFEGQPQDRNFLTSSENRRLSEEIRRFLLLLSPHMLAQSAQECLEGLLRFYHVHQWNVDEVLAAVLPYHDSPFFVRLLQGLHVEGSPRWSWLKTIKEKPTSLVRQAVAKYCAKDTSLLTFFGELLQEMAKMQKTNRALIAFFTSVWLDTLATVREVSPALALAALPPVLHALRRPHLRDGFHAAVVLAGGLCTKTPLDTSVKAQLCEHAAKCLDGDLRKAAMAFIVLVVQLQGCDALSPKVLKSFLAVGAETVVHSLPAGLESRNLVVTLVEHCYQKLVARPQEEQGEGGRRDHEQVLAFTRSLMGHQSLVELHGKPISLAILQVFHKACVARGADDAERERVIGILQEPLEVISQQQPLALSAAFTKAVAYASSQGVGAEPFVQLLTPSGVTLPSAEEGATVDLVRAFSDRSAATRLKAVQKASEDLERSERGAKGLPKQQLLVNLLLQAVQDKDLEVTTRTLRLEHLWASSSHASPTTTAPLLLSLLGQLLPPTKLSRDGGLKEILAAAFCSEDPAGVLVPLAIQRLAAVYCRADCLPALQSQIDLAVMPLLVLILAAPEEAGGRKALGELRAAGLRFCQVSSHAYLAGIAKAAGNAKASSLRDAAAREAGLDAAHGLSHLVEGRPWADVSAAPQEDDAADDAMLQPRIPTRLGGAGTQLAATKLLAAAIPKIASEAEPKVQRGEVEKILQRCAEAAEQFARHLTRMEPKTGASGSELFCDLAQEVLRAAAAALRLSDQADASKTAGRRRKSKGSAGPATATSQTLPPPQLSRAVACLVRTALTRPKVLMPVLKEALGGCRRLMQPVVLQLALGHGTGGSGEMQANALLMLRSIVRLPDAQDWPLDQCLVVPLAAAIAAAETAEARSAAMAVLEALCDEEREAASEIDYDGGCFQTLRAADIVRHPQELLSARGWASAQGEASGITAMQKASLQAFFELLQSQKANILQDRMAVCTALSKFLAGKGGAVKPARLQDCGFWGLGVAALVRPHGTQPSPLLGAMPPAGLLQSLQAPLEGAMQDLTHALQHEDMSKVRVPTMLLVVAHIVRDLLLADGVDPGTSTSTKVAAAAAANKQQKQQQQKQFLEAVALPCLTTLSSCCLAACGATSQVELPEAVVELVAAMGAVGGAACAGTASDNGVPRDLQIKAAGGLLALCTALSKLARLGTKDDMEEEAEEAVAATPIAASATARGAPAAFAAVRDAFVLSAMDEALLRQALQSPAWKSQSSDVGCRSVALQVVGQQIAGFSSLGDGAGQLLEALSKAAAREAAEEGAAEQLGADRALMPALFAVAALSEKMSGPSRSAEANYLPAAAAACKHLGQVCEALGERLTSTVLAAVVRICAALAPLTEEQAAGGPPPASLQVCVASLLLFQGQLGSEQLGLLKMPVWRFWRHPKARPEASPMEAEALSQTRVRLLLHTAFARCQSLIPTVNVDVALSFAQSAGVRASLDFALVLFLVRQHRQLGLRRPPRKKKRRDAEEQGPEAAALEQMVTAVENDTAVVEEALTLVHQVSAPDRFFCIGSLAQTLSCLAFELAKARHGGKLPMGKQQQHLSAFWGAAMLPADFVEDVGEDGCFWVLAKGLEVLRNFLEEHGLPEALDEAEPDVVAPRGVSSSPAPEENVETTDDAIEQAADVTAVAAQSVCYIVKASCVIEGLLEIAGGGAADAPKAPAGIEPCRQGSQELRAFLLRSLAVNHPRAFFQTLCFSMQIDGMAPAVEATDLLASKHFVLAEARMLLAEAEQALNARAEGARGAAAPSTGCWPLSAAAMRHVCDNHCSSSSSSSKSGGARDGSREARGAAGSSALDTLQASVWRFLAGLCRFSAKSHPQPVVEACIPAAAACLQQAVREAPKGAAAMDALLACCHCLSAAVGELGRTFLECMTIIMPSLLDLASSPSTSGKAGAQLEAGIFDVLQTVLRTVGPFLSPYLDRFLQLLAASAAPRRLALLEGLGRTAVESVPHRLLIKRVEEGVAAAEGQLVAAAQEEAGDVEVVMATVGGCLVRLQRLAVMLLLMFSSSPPEFVSEVAETVMETLLRLFAAGCRSASIFMQAGGQPEEVPVRVLCRSLSQTRIAPPPAELGWTEWCREGGVLRLYSLTAAAFAHFALRLSVDNLRPRFAKVLSWTRNMQASALQRQAQPKKGDALTGTEDDSTDAEDACRVLALSLLMQSLANEAPDISVELFLPLALKDLASCLGAARRQALRLAARHKVAKKRKRAAVADATADEGPAGRGATKVLHLHTWWWFDVAQVTLDFVGDALREAGDSSTRTRAVVEAVEALAEPSAELLSLFEFLPAVDESDLSGAFLEAAQKAIVALAAASDGPGMKKLLTAVLSKSRSGDAELRLCSVNVCHKIWLEIGAQAVSALSEVIMFAVELLEDEDPRVETAVRAMVKTMEECTGESLQDHLKR